MGKLKPKKEREAKHFHLFQEKYGLFQEYKHKDNPDFLVTYGNEILGIEFTEIYKEEKLNELKPRVHEAIKERIVNRACQKAIDSKLPPLHVRIHFSKIVKKKRENFVTEKLFHIVEANCPKIGESIRLDFHNSIPEEFHLISINNMPGCNKHSWHFTEASFVYTDFSDQLQKMISSKAEKLPRYLEHCKTCWLVIAALGATGSSLYEFSEQMNQHSYNSHFEKVFFIDSFSGDLRELNLNRNF